MRKAATAALALVLAMCLCACTATPRPVAGGRAPTARREAPATMVPPVLAVPSEWSREGTPLPEEAAQGIPADDAFVWVQLPFVDCDAMEPVRNEAGLVDVSGFVNIQKNGRWGMLQFDDAAPVFEPADHGPAYICSLGCAHDTGALPLENEDAPPAAGAFPLPEGGGHCGEGGHPYAYARHPQTGILTLLVLDLGSFATAQEARDRLSDGQLPPLVPVVELDVATTSREAFPYDGPFGLATGDGRLVLTPAYDEVDLQLHDGVCAMRKGDAWGLVTVPGKYVVSDCVLDGQWWDGGSPGVFEDGLCPVMRDGKAGVINKQGMYVVPPLFDGISHIKNGRVWVKTGGLWGQIEIVQAT